MALSECVEPLKPTLEIYLPNSVSDLTMAMTHALNLRLEIHSASSDLQSRRRVFHNKYLGGK